MNQTFFIMHTGEKAINLKYVEKYGVPYSIGSDGFASIVNKAKNSYLPVKKIEPVLLCFDKIQSPKNPKEILDKDVFGLLYEGSFNLDKLYYSVQSPEDYPYCIYRSKIDEVIKLIEEGEKKILIHSDLGNGKTIFVRSLENILCSKDFIVYHYRKYRSTAEREIEQICQNHSKTVIVLEDYVGNMDLLRYFSTIYTDQVFIVTERTAVNDANYYSLYEKFGDFVNIDINLLNTDEISSFVMLLDHYGLWHEFAAKSTSAKEDFIRITCKQRISNVILKLLNSPGILNRFKDIIEKIKSKNVYYDAILFILIAHISKLNIDLDDLSNALDTTKLNTPAFKKDPTVREFIDFSNDEIIHKSSIISEFILGHLLESAVVVEVMIKIFKRLATQNQDPATRRILRKMMTFTNIQHILNRKDPDYSSSLLHFYETIGKLSYCRKNPHYWLQYAIVMLSQYNYPQADAYFQNAYAYAKNLPDFDTYQIDNHHARFILENEREYGSNDTCMEAFSQAHKTLMDPKHKIEVRHYPYRVAQNYYPFYEKFYAGMKDGEKKIFINACNEMLNRIAWYESTTKETHIDVKKAKERLQLIVSMVSI